MVAGASDRLQKPAAWRIAVVGGGPAGLMAAETLAARGAVVTIYDRMPSIGRKFLLAGRGGLNLTHSEPLDRFLPRYGAAATHLRSAVNALVPAKLIAWCEALGQPTFVGSSGRVFPKSMKASPLLRSWLQRLAGLGVEFRLRHAWVGWEDDGRLIFNTPQSTVAVTVDAAILSLGGASWPQLGSDGAWVRPLGAAGVAITPLQPANCGFTVRWSDMFRDRFAGAPLKDVQLRADGGTARGEVMITQSGVEGGAIYTLGPKIRQALNDAGEAVVQVDLRPNATAESLAFQLSSPRGKQSLSTFLRKVAKLSPAAIGLMHESAFASRAKLSTMTPDDLAQWMKAAPVRLHAAAPIEKAISTAGGVKFDELDEHFMLRRLPGIFVAGEMVDWEAPTGGYLLQACFATGAAAALGALHWLESNSGQANARPPTFEA